MGRLITETQVRYDTLVDVNVLLVHFYDLPARNARNCLTKQRADHGRGHDHAILERSRLPVLGPDAFRVHSDEARFETVQVDGDEVGAFGRALRPGFCGFKHAV